jgi:hypothetical protein
MADVKISAMSAASALTGAEVLPVVQGAANVKATAQQVVDAAMTTGLTRQALGSINTNTTIDWSAGSYVTATIGGALTFTFSNPAPTGKACVAYLQLTNGGSAAITWPVSVTWSGGTAPTLRAAGVDLLRFYTQDNGTTWFGTAENDESSVAGGTGTKTLARFTASDNNPPASSFATIDTRNSVLVLDFDDASVESAVFVGQIPEGADLSSGISVRLYWMATSATTGNVRWRAEFEADGSDLDSDSFDTATEATGAANGTSGIETMTAFTCTTIDSLAAGDRFRLKISRVGNDGTNDTMSGDAELVAVELRQVA